MLSTLWVFGELDTEQAVLGEAGSTEVITVLRNGRGKEIQHGRRRVDVVFSPPLVLRIEGRLQTAK